MHPFFINRILILLSISFYACTSYVPVQKTVPPEIVLQEEMADFLFVNRFVPNDLDYNNENKMDVFELGVEKYISGLKSGFDTSSHLSLIMSDTIFPSHSAHEPAYNLSQTTIRSLCDEYNPDYIFSLDNYDLYFDQDVDVQENDDGSKSKTAYYDLVLNTFITIYSCEGNVVDKLKEELRILHDKRGVLSGLFAVGPSMGKADENVAIISNELGRKFIMKFYSTDISEMRVFYSNKEFASAFRAFKIKDWNTVEKELIQLTEHSDTKTQGRAAYNLAVYYENQGKVSEMEYWYRRAEEKLGSLPENHLNKFIAPN